MRDFDRFQLPSGAGAEIAAELLDRLLKDPADSKFDALLSLALVELMRVSNHPDIGWDESIRGTRVVFGTIHDQLVAVVTGRDRSQSMSASQAAPATSGQAVPSETQAPSTDFLKPDAPGLSESDATVLRMLAELPGGTGLSEETLNDRLTALGFEYGTGSIRQHVVPKLRKHVEITNSRPVGYRVHDTDRARALRIAAYFGARSVTQVSRKST